MNIGAPSQAGSNDVDAQAGDLLLDAKMSADQLDVLKGDVLRLKSKVVAGGRTAQSALGRLVHLATEPNARAVMKTLGIPFAAARSLKSESSNQMLERLAGSLITLLTDMPVTAETSDAQTGANGHVFIEVPRPSRLYSPDVTMSDLAAGVQPSDTLVGDYMQRIHAA